MKQIVGHKLNTLQGLLLILALFVVLILLNYVVLNYIAALLGSTAASIAFWVIGGAIALWILRTYIVVYTYEINGNVLRLCRKYGKRERFIEDIYLNKITYVGTIEEAKRRDPQANTVKAVHSAVKYEKTAVLFGTSEGTKIAILQANEDLKAKLIAAAKERKKN